MKADRPRIYSGIDEAAELGSAKAAAAIAADDLDPTDDDFVRPTLSFGSCVESNLISTKFKSGAVEGGRA